MFDNTLVFNAHPSLTFNSTLTAICGVTEYGMMKIVGRVCMLGGV